MNELVPEARAPRPLRRIVSALLVSAIDAALLALALGGLAPLLHDARSLALLATWTASSLMLGLLRPSRERAGREAEPRAVLLALVAIPLFTPAISAWTVRLGFGVVPGGAVLRWSGVALAALGLAVRIAAMARLGRRFSPRLEIQRDHALETGGLYSRIRHPGYLGALVTNLGAAVAFTSLVGLAMVALLAVIVRVRIAREELLLARRFGAEYESYRARTGPFLPRLKPARPARPDPGT